MKVSISIVLIFTAVFTFGQTEKVYHWHPEKDALIMISSGMLWGGSEYLKSVADIATEEEINLLDKNNLWSIDRSATDNLSPSSAKISDYILYSSISFPALHFLDKKGREHSGIILAMTLEAFLINDGITSFLKATTSRYRPFTYNPEVPLEDKLSNGARYSFASGHTSNVAVLSFLSAKIYSDLYPESKFKPFVWILAATIPAATGYLRYKAGRHFPTDVLAGYAIGATVGILIPHFHKNTTHDHAFRVISNGQGIGLSFTKTLK